MNAELNFDPASLVRAYLESNVENLTFESPTSLLGYVLTEHRDGFFYFLLNGARRALTSASVKKAMDVFVEGNSAEIAAVEREGICPNEWTHAQFSPASVKGTQNLYALAYICDIVE